MTKFQLDVEYDYDFDLIGISCHSRDYRLCWALNQQLGTALAKREEDIDHKPRRQNEVSAHSFYEYQDEDDRVEYFLLANKSGSSMLVPEQKQADYLLLLRNNYVVEIAELIARIKAIDIVLTAFRIEVDTLKSKENLIF